MAVAKGVGSKKPSSYFLDKVSTPEPMDNEVHDKKRLRSERRTTGTATTKKI